MAYTIEALSDRDSAIHCNGRYIGAVSRFDDGISRGKPAETYYLSSRDSFDCYHLTLDDAIAALVRKYYAAIGRAHPKA